MARGKDFKVLIAGGSIAGLTLANVLERLGVDYLLLESHGDIAPQVGASIGMLPNGLRVLDQLGMYEAVQALLDCKLSEGGTYEPGGKELKLVKLLEEELPRRCVTSPSSALDGGAPAVWLTD